MKTEGNILSCLMALGVIGVGEGVGGKMIQILTVLCLFYVAGNYEVGGCQKKT